MACAWENKRRAVEICSTVGGYLHELGSYVYIGLDSGDPDYSLIEVPKDLSGYIKHGFVGAFTPPATERSSRELYSKQRRVFRKGESSSNVYVHRHDGAGTFSEVTTMPDISATINSRSQFVASAGRVRMTNYGPSAILYASDDGENWDVVAGPIVGSDVRAYTTLGSRLVAMFDDSLGEGIKFSDDGGVTWTSVTGDNSGITPMFVHSGGRLLYASYSGWDVTVSADGETWSTAGFQSRSNGHPVICSNGAGVVMVLGNPSQFDTAPRFYRSTDDGASWTEISYSSAGIPAGSFSYGLFWDGAQFVCLFRNGSFGPFQIYTSTTGTTWSPSLIIPDVIEDSAVQIID